MSIERRMALIGHLHEQYADITASATISGLWNFTTAPTISGNTIWHSGNDGTGSGLDADTLDGSHATAFAALAESETITGSWTFTTSPAISRADPQFGIWETDQATDEGKWRFIADAKKFYLQSAKDDYSGFSNIFVATRGTGKAITALEFVSTDAAPTTFYGAVTVNNSSPTLQLKESDAAADEGYWRLLVAAKVLYFRAYDDALSTSSDFFKVTRGTGKAISTINYGNSTDSPSHTFAGDVGGWNGNWSITDTAASSMLTLKATASHITFYEDGVADELDRGLVELNANELNLYGYDNSAATWRRFLGGNVSTGGVVIGASGNGIGFYGGTATTKQTVTGSRGGNAALASLLTALANIGLITNSSTA